MLNEQLSKPPMSGLFVEAIEAKEAAVSGLLNIMPELEAWLRQGRIRGTEEEITLKSVKPESEGPAMSDGSVIDFPTERVYHRNVLYR